MNKKIIFIALAAVILGGLFMVMKPNAVSHETETPIVSRETSSTKALSPTTPEVKADLIVKNSKIESGPEAIKANEGDMITINVIADVSDEIHIHGLDKHLELEANKPGSVTFKADKAGRFPFELEAAKKDLGVIEIQPR